MFRRRNRKKVYAAVSALSLVAICYSIYYNAEVDTEHHTSVSGKSRRDVARAGAHDSVGLCDKEYPLACYSQGLVPKADSFYLNGTAFRIMSGSFHYFRTLPEQWDDRFKRMRSAGLNTVTTYIAWNVHEKIKGQFTFSGRYDISHFVKLAAANGLFVIIRAGPYICAEWEFGGLPSWLLSDDQMIFRSSKYKPYIDHIDNYFSKLLPILEKLSYNRGGPIIAFQLENEFSHMHTYDFEYLKLLEKMHRKNGIKELLFTSDASGSLDMGSLEGVYATVNFGQHAQAHFNTLLRFQPHTVLMTAEFWPGWFDAWGTKHQLRDAKHVASTLSEVIKMQASFNLYMFVGSTNFEFYNGGNELDKNLKTITTSYDYDAPISEHGAITKKYKAIREVLIDNKLADKDHLPPIPDNPVTKAYDPVALTQYVTYDTLVSIIEKIHGRISLDRTSCMEKLPINNNGGQGYGYILYRIYLERLVESLAFDGVKDYAYVILNNQIVSSEERSGKNIRLKVNKDKIKQNSNEQNILDIFVESKGRINFATGKNAQKSFQNQRKGVLGNITVNSEVVASSILHIPFEFDERFLQELSKSSKHVWKERTKDEVFKTPTLFRGTFMLHQSPKDTFILTNKWGNGIVFVNGHHLGRYYDVGPQQTLYVPFPTLKTGENEILVFEHKSPDKIEGVVFNNVPKLG